MDIGFGRLVTFASPAIYLPWSTPQYCHGEGIWGQNDFVGHGPVGFVHAGL
jgi:hypothetical protein